MTHIDREVRRAQTRLWLNRWLNALGWCLVIGLGLWLATWLPNQFFSLALPMKWISIGLATAAFLGSVVWSVITRPRALEAATALDVAAGLRERVSTSLSLAPEAGDEFERAVRGDAERSVAGLNAKRFLPVQWPGSLSTSALILVVALLTLLIPELDLLGGDDSAAEAGVKKAESKVTAKAISRPVNIIKKVAEQNPDVDLANLEQPNMGEFGERQEQTPDFKRRQAVKQLNALRDALQNKANSDQYRTLRELRKRLRQIGAPEDPKSELRELMNDLSEGDFEGAQNAVKKLQESLAKRARDGKLNAADREKMKKQLDDLAKKLKKAAERQQKAQDRQMQRQLQNAGLSEQDAKRALEALSKKDPEQLKKMAEEMAQKLKDQGVTQQQMQKMLEKMQEQQKAQQQANQQCQKMGQSMKQAGQSMEEGNLDQAQQQMSQSSDMLNEMEQMEQALNDIQSQMSDLDQAEQDLENAGDEQQQQQGCDGCNGTGFLPDGAQCPKCGGSGQQGGGQGQGGQGQGQGQGQGNNARGSGRAFGARDRNDDVDTDTRDEKAKTKQGRGGSIIGQNFVKGSQFKGDVHSTAGDAAAAGEVDSTDHVHRTRVPRRYRGSVARYFDRDGEPAGSSSNGGDEKSSGGESSDDGAASGDGEK